MKEFQDVTAEAFQQLELPKFKYGPGMQLFPKIDFEKVFAELTEMTPSIKGNAAVEDALPELLIPLDESKLIAAHYHAMEEPFIVHIKNSGIVEIDSVLETNAGAETIFIIVDEGVEATILETSTQKKGIYKSQLVQIHARQGSSLKYIAVQQLGTAANFTQKRAQIHPNATLEMIDIIVGGSFSQMHATVALEKGAESSMQTVFLPSAEQTMDVMTNTIHLDAHSTSEMTARGAVLGKAVYRGTVDIRKEAAHAVGHQSAKALLLSEEAKCDAIPVLEVANDEVQCSHGAAVGKVSENQLFYLQSRGISKEEAMKQIVRGFLMNGLQELPEEHVDKILEDKFNA